MSNSFPLNQADFYKPSHKKFMHSGCTSMYANFTARSGKYAKWYGASDQRVVWIGLQHFIKDFLIGEFNREFFHLSKSVAVRKFQRRMDTSLGAGAVNTAHIEALYERGYVPLSIKALPEGSKVPFKVPLATWVETEPQFAWLVTYIETVFSQENWGPCTSATTAYQFLKLFNHYADQTVGNREHVPFQGHDFSARGMFGRHAAALSGLGHLLSFVGTDTIAAIDLVEDFYNVNAENYLIGTSVPASEHSVTSLGIAAEGEYETLERWVTQTYPDGIVSVVSDTLDYWKVLTYYLPRLEKKIRARKKNSLGLSKVVIRPDSGDPVKIVCGDPEAKAGSLEFYGSIDLLWKTFGGKKNAKGFKELDPCVGLIYGDSITLDRAEAILEGLKAKGFASNCVVFGLGSYTYQAVTRDTLGFAVKATSAVVDGKRLDLSKNPVTDDGTKKSAVGLMRVEQNEDGQFVMFDGQTEEQESQGELREVFRNGVLLVEEDFATMRARLLAD